MKLIEKNIITGTILLKTGLHIGGSKSSLDIGGLDSPVIKTPLGVPYIPGSSLKGKIRTLLGLSYGAFKLEEDKEITKKMFGSAEKDWKEPTRLIFRDAVLDVDKFMEMFTNKNASLETDFSEEKYENTIDRKSGKTTGGGLRNIERVPAGAVFSFEIVINVFDKDDKDEMLKELEKGLSLLQDDYLGGSGTRGYGKVEIACNIKNPISKTYE